MIRKIIAAAAAVSLAAGGIAYAGGSGEKNTTLIIEAEGGAALDYITSSGAEYGLYSESVISAEENIKAMQQEIKSEIDGALGYDVETGYTYTRVFNGFSIDARESDIKKIKSLPNVKNVYVSRCYKTAENAEVSEFYSENCCEMMNAGYMHDNGFTGRGAVIAIIDDGFDVSHEIFKGSVAAPRLSEADIAAAVGGGDLALSSSSDYKDADKAYRSEKIPFAYNYFRKNADVYNYSDSHGTHVAGIAAGNNGTDPDGGKFVSAAPDAQLLLMACTVLTDEAILAAMDDAVKLGANVINASWSNTNSERNSPIETALHTAYNAGILFSAAAGNAARGYDGKGADAENIDYGSAGMPNCFSPATSVANADNTGVWEFYYEMTAGGDTIRFSDQNAKASFAELCNGEKYEFIYVGTGTARELENTDLQGKIALAERGEGLTFASRIALFKPAGAVGAIFINSEDNRNITITPASMQDIPTALITLSDGERIKPLSSGEVQTENILKHSFEEYPDASINSSSSWGVASSLELKPEITAPGGSIYSSVNKDKYENMTGTSMAAPHMAGAAAVMNEFISERLLSYAQGRNKAQLAENIIMTSADVLMQDKDTPLSPRLQGAGMVNLEKAAKTPVILIGDRLENENITVEKSKISLGEIESNEFSISFTARNMTDADAVYDTLAVTVITDNADADNKISGMKKLKSDTEIPSAVTVPAYGSAEITARLTLDADELKENLSVFRNGFYIDGFVFMSDSGGNVPEISIPFSGFYGGWENAPALDKPVFSGESLLGETYLASRTRRQSDGSMSYYLSYNRLGTNMFVPQGSEDYDEYCSEDFAGISPDGDGENDVARGIAVPLRALGVTDVEVYTADGELVAAKTDIDSDTNEPYYAEKFEPTYLYPGDETVAALKEGDYIFKVKSGFYGQKSYSQNESVEMKFYIDRQKPIITEYKTRQEGERTYLDITARDNRHLMGIIISGEKDNEPFTDVYPIKGLSEYALSVDITDVKEGTLRAEVLDYAQNCSLRTTPNFVVSSCEAGDNSVTLCVNNTSGAEINAEIITAFYSGGALAGIKSGSVTLPEDVSYQSFGGAGEEFDTVKVFVWSGAEKMKPLYEKFEFYGE